MVAVVVSAAEEAEVVTVVAVVENAPMAEVAHPKKTGFQKPS